MNKIMLPIIGVIINIVMYSSLPYDGEFGLLIIVALVVSIVLGFVLGLIADGIKRKATKFWTIVLSIMTLIGISFWIFPFVK